MPLNGTGTGREGIVHVMGPELGLTQPGMTIVCGDSHTSTHGAFGALAFGIGTSEVEHVLATQTLPQSRPKTMLVRFDGELPFGVTAKDMVLGAIGRVGVAGGVGHVLEYAGPAIETLSMEGRMTICNMSIEAGARAGMIAPDETTFAYLLGRPAAPAVVPDAWRALRSDPDAEFDRVVDIDVAELVPQVTWGTNPGMVAPVDGVVPDPASYADAAEREAVERALRYMALEPGTPIGEIRIDRVFIGSCTNARIEDLRAAAAVVERAARRAQRARDGRPGLGDREAAGRGGGARPRVRRGGLRVAAGGLLDVPRDEPGHPRPRRALREHVEPELRGPPGRRRPDAPRLAGDGRGGRARRPLRRRAGARMSAAVLVGPVRCPWTCLERAGRS